MLTDILVGVAINLITGMAWNVAEGKTPPMLPLAIVQSVPHYTPTKTTVWSTE